jgi:hypothetical protein
MWLINYVVKYTTKKNRVKRAAEKFRIFPDSGN